MPGSDERPDGAPVSQPAASSASETPRKLDKSYYTWSTLFSVWAGTATQETMMNYLKERDVVEEERDCQKCEKNRDFLLKYSALAGSPSIPTRSAF